jgi:hypothetical protein
MNPTDNVSAQRQAQANTQQFSILSCNKGITAENTQHLDAIAAFVYMGCIITFISTAASNDKPAKVSVLEPVTYKELAELATVEMALEWVNHQSSALRSMINEVINKGGIIVYTDGRCAPCYSPEWTDMGSKVINGIEYLATLGINISVEKTAVDYQLDENNKPPLTKEEINLIERFNALSLKVENVVNTIKNVSVVDRAQGEELLETTKDLHSSYAQMTEEVKNTPSLFNACQKAMANVMTQFDNLTEATHKQ